MPTIRPFSMAKPCGVCMNLFDAMIQNVEISVPNATISVEKKRVRVFFHTAVHPEHRFSCRRRPDALRQAAYGRLVKRSVKRRINGAATTTTGNIVSQEMPQDLNQCCKKAPSLTKGRLAIAAAIAQVTPDWITP